MRKTYKDIFGWFPEESADILRLLIKDHDILTVTEVGSFLGKSTVFFAEEDCIVNAVDPFTTGKWSEVVQEALSQECGDDFYEKFLFNIQDYKNQITPFRMTSEEAAKTEVPRDLVYIDAEHTYESVKRDIELWDWLATKIICGDDYTSIYPGVVKAVYERYGNRVRVYGQLWYVIK